MKIFLLHVSYFYVHVIYLKNTNSCWRRNSNEARAIEKKVVCCCNDFHRQMVTELFSRETRARVMQILCSLLIGIKILSLWLNAMEWMKAKRGFRKWQASEGWKVQQSNLIRRFCLTWKREQQNRCWPFMFYIKLPINVMDSTYMHT